MLTTGNDRFRSGLDVVVEGSAVRTTDDSLLRRLAAPWASKLEWAFDVSGGAFHHGGTETGGTAHVYAVAPTKVLAFGKGEPFSQIRTASPSATRSTASGDARDPTQRHSVRSRRRRTRDRRHERVEPACTDLPMFPREVVSVQAGSARRVTPLRPLTAGMSR